MNHHLNKYHKEILTEIPEVTSLANKGVPNDVIDKILEVHYNVDPNESSHTMLSVCFLSL